MSSDSARSSLSHMAGGDTRVGLSEDTMANRNYPQSRLYTNHFMPVSIDAKIAIGATGAPSIASGDGYGIASITRMAAGQYRIQLQDNFAKLLQFKATLQSPASGTPVAGGAFSVGVVYKIISLGTTTQAQWEAAGVPSGITAAAGVVFKAATVGAGTGSVQTLVSSGINSVELLGSSSNMLNSAPLGQTIPNLGGYVDFQCMGPTGAALTAPIATDPVSGSAIFIEIVANNSQIQ